MSATLTIAGVAYTFIEDTLTISPVLNERQRMQCTVIDYAGTVHFQAYMQVVLTDPVLGVRFRGFINTSKETPRYPSGVIEHAIDCIDLRYLADKRTFTGDYSTPTLAGKIVVDQLDAVLADEGVTQNYAVHVDTTDSDFNQGILNNVVGASNVGDGDLELALAGSTVTILEDATADFATGSLSGCVASNNQLSPIATSTLKITGTMSIPSTGNTFTYFLIWSGSQAVSNNYLAYDVFIPQATPDPKIGVDLVFDDGSTLRGVSTRNDVQNLPPNPATDLSGFAVDQWYHREFFLDNFNGRNIVQVQVAIEGDKTGDYIGYIKNIAFETSLHAVSFYFFSGTLNVNPPQQVSNFGYSTAAISIVQTWQPSSFRLSPAYSLDAAKLLRSSYMSWQSSEPAGSKVIVGYSLDGGNSFIGVGNNVPLRNLPAGLSLAGKSIQIIEEFLADPASNEVASPEVFPVLSKVQLTVQPSYNASKSDVTYSTAAAGTWSAAGTSFTNTAVTGNALTLNGFVRYFDDADYSNMTNFGSGFLNFGADKKTFFINCTTGNDGRARCDFAGTWQNFTAEVDVQVFNGGDVDLEYRTTNWGNSLDSYAYIALVNLGDIRLIKGTNSTGAGGATTITTVNFFSPLQADSWHRLKVVVSGNNHKIYMDNILMINVNDSTWTAAGNIGLRTFNNTGGVHSAHFDNFGVCASLSGTWTSPNTSLTSAGTYGDSIATWADFSKLATNTSLLVEASLNGGSTYATCTNGAAIPGFVAGQSLSGVNLKFRITETSTTATALPGIGYFTARVLGAFSASGTRSTVPLGNDTMVRADVGSGFGTGFDSQTYTKVGTGTTSLTSNEAQISNTTGDVHMVYGSRTWTDEDATDRFSLSASTISSGIELRYQDANNFYRLAASTTTITITKKSAGFTTLLATVPAPLATNAFFRMRFRVTGSSPVLLYGEVWPDSTLEPIISGSNNWTITATD